MHLRPSIGYLARIATLATLGGLVLLACRQGGGRSFSASTRAFLPVVADAAGASGRVWKTSLVVEAGRPGETTEISVLFTDQLGVAHRGRILLAPGGGQRIDDLFGMFREALQPPLAEGAQLGTVELAVTDGALPGCRVEIHATDSASGGRIGQSYTSDSLVASSGPLVVPGVATNTETRANVGVANPGGGEVEVEIRLHDFENGIAVGDPMRIKVGPRRLATLGDVVRLLHAPAETRAVSVKFKVIGEASDIFAYGSIVDSRTDGAIFVPASPER